MKRLTNKLLLSIMTLALVVVTLSASTFAWFTLGNDAKLENVRLNVQASSGMEVSEDGRSWKNKIALGVPTSAIEFTALTTYKGAKYNNDTEDGALLYEEGVVIRDRLGNVVSFTDPTQLQGDDKNHFFEKTFYVRITNTNNVSDFAGVSLKSVTPDPDLAIDFGNAPDGATKDLENPDNNTYNENQWLSDFDYTGTKTYQMGKYYNFDGLNAIKISFATIREVDETTHAKAEVATFLYGYENTYSQGTVSLNGTAKAYADAKEYAYTIPQDRAAQGTPGEDGYEAPVLGTLPTYINDLTNHAGKVLDASDFFTAEEASQEEDQSQGKEEGILAFTNLDLDENYLYAKVTIRIWLDGWDADCINAILDQECAISILLEAFKN